MASKPKNKMSVQNRAKQFMPFAALSGYEAALAAKEKIQVPKIELSEDMAFELDQKMKLLTKGQMASVIYYEKGEYLKKTGLIAKIDTTCRILQVVSTKICFDDILDITLHSEGITP